MKAERSFRHPGVYQAIVDFCDRGDAFVLATVLKTGGSTPAKAGAKAIVDPSGTICGTIGGGKAEAEAIRSALEAIRTGVPIVFDFVMEGEAAAGSAPICGGTMRILVDPTAPRHRAAYSEAAVAQDRRQPGALLTSVRTASPVEVSVRFLARPARGSEMDRPDAEVLVEPVIPRPLLLMVGGGHIGQAVALQASMVGFDIVAIDDRLDFTRPELFPTGITVLCGPIGEQLDSLSFDQETYVVVATRDHQHDAEALGACFGKPAAYLGMIGSRRKVAMLRKEFVESGQTTAAEFDWLHAPIGLDIGAVTVPEIATSIVAQLIATRRKASAR